MDTNRLGRGQALVDGPCGAVIMEILVVVCLWGQVVEDAELDRSRLSCLQRRSDCCQLQRRSRRAFGRLLCLKGAGRKCYPVVQTRSQTCKVEPPRARVTTLYSACFLDLSTDQEAIGNSEAALFMLKPK